MKLQLVGIVVMLILPITCLAQSSAAGSGEQASKAQVKPAPVDCKRNQSWSQTEERCVTTVTCEKAKQPWTLRCLVEGEYKNTSLQRLYKRGFRLSEISAKGAYYFKDVR